MSIRLPVGADVTQARNGYVEVPPPEHSGRIASISGPFWISNNRYPSYPGYDGFDDPTEYRDQSDVLLQAAVQWLTTLDTGAHILVCWASPNPRFGVDVQGGLGRLGHTFDASGSAGLNGFDPTNYDCVFCGVLDGADIATIDDYLDYGGAVLTYADIAYPLAWSRYGWKAATPYQDRPTYQKDVECAPFGAATYTYVLYTDPQLATETKTRPGTTTFYANVDDEDVIALWVNE
jgi:hypothetical protein